MRTAPGPPNTVARIYGDRYYRAVEWTIEIRGEVRQWYQGLKEKDRLVADRVLHRLRIQGNTLGMPRSKPLGDGLFELRFTCEGLNRRITYVFDPDRKVITLTTFHKQKNNERREILRARRAQAARAAEQTTKRTNRRK